MSVDFRAPILVGSRLGHFVIRGMLGTGGMGQVYDAEDTRLHRPVALKVVRFDVASDPVRRARLEREAGAVAMLNHPNIVTVHSLEEHDGILFIAMERIDGTPLAAAMPEHGFPFERLVPLALQLTDALSAAHNVGIVHRDLKPTNIMVTVEGTLKVVDFGLSRLAVDEDRSSATVDVLTGSGSLIGTAPYMSPEQIEGHPADARSDLFALGVVLFEMAVGRRPFTGRTPLAILTAISKDPAPFASDIRPEVPEAFARIIDRCLVKDPARRMQSAVDLRGQIEDFADIRPGATSVRTERGSIRRRPDRVAGNWNYRTVVGGAILAAAMLVLIGAVAARRAIVAGDSRVTRFSFDVPKNAVILPEFNSHLALSPDGTHLAFAALPGPVWIRRIDRLEARAVDVTNTPGFRGAPLFSPDGTAVSFIEGNAAFSSVRPFYRTALSGGAAVKLAEYDAFHKGDWSSDGWIYWTAQYPGGIVRIRDTGGNPERVTDLDLQRGERSHRFASLLPGGQAFLYTVASDGMSTYDDARIDLFDLRSHQRRTLIAGGTSAVYSPSGHIVYARRGKLLAVPFDLARLEVTGAPVDVITGVQTSSDTGAADFALSRRGDLAYVPGSAAGGHRSLVWVDRSGKAQPLPLQTASYLYPRLSPDGRRLAMEIEGPNHDLYVYDFDRTVLTKMTTDGGSHDPVWAPDGKRLAFRSWVAGGMTMWMMAVDRSVKPSRLDPAGTRQSPVSISVDGKFLAFDQKDPETRDDVWVLPLDGERAQPVAHSRFAEGSAKFSPDGRWIAYASDESGRSEVYVQAFPGSGPRVQVSNAGGFDPIWRKLGGELYYRHSRDMMAVSIDGSKELQFSAPRKLWDGDYSDGAASSCGMPGVSSSNYDVTPDGQRFLMVRDEDSRIAGTRIVVVLNWSSELRQGAAQSTVAHR